MFKELAILFVVGACCAMGGCAKSQEFCPSAMASLKAVKTIAFAEGKVAFEELGDPDFPVVVSYYSKNCQRIVIDKYGWEGGAPKVEFVFDHPLQGEPHLWVIVSWPLNHPGMGTKGSYYQVYAYSRRDSGLLERNAMIDTSDAMSGVEGFADHEESHFFGKTPEELRSLIGTLGSK